MSDEPKFCVNCKWYSKSPYAALILHRCAVPSITEVDLVTGAQVFRDCHDERDKRGACGPDAKHFALRPKPEITNDYLCVVDQEVHDEFVTSTNNTIRKWWQLT